MARLTAKELLASKGRRQFTKLSITTPEQAAAAEAAGIDVLSASYYPEKMAAMRAAAPSPFFVYSLPHGPSVTAEDELRTAFDARDLGADACYCSMRMPVVELLASEGIPVIGHVGLVPVQKTWSGGLKPVGKTADEAMTVWKKVKAYEDAGAVGLEMELVPARVAAEISKRTKLIIFSMGSGSNCDGQFLFACDVLGETDGHIPRHAKTYDDFKSHYLMLQERRVLAFGAYRDDVVSGAYPQQNHEVKISDSEFEEFTHLLAKA